MGWQLLFQPSRIQIYVYAKRTDLVALDRQPTHNGKAILHNKSGMIDCATEITWKKTNNKKRCTPNEIQNTFVCVLKWSSCYDGWVCVFVVQFVNCSNLWNIERKIEWIRRHFLKLKRSREKITTHISNSEWTEKKWNKLKSWCSFSMFISKANER